MSIYHAGTSDSRDRAANALLFRSEGLLVGVVRDGTRRLVPITIGRDYGDKVEVVSGLGAATTRLILIFDGRSAAPPYGWPSATRPRSPDAPRLLLA